MLDRGRLEDLYNNYHIKDRYGVPFNQFLADFVYVPAKEKEGKSLSQIIGILIEEYKSTKQN